MKSIDTAEYLICDRCDKGIEPSEEKLVLGIEYKSTGYSDNYFEVYCAECTPIVLDFIAEST